jgi:phosphoribosylamine---glycine ligase
MNILLIGSGGREHAIAWKLSQSKKLNKLFIAPGNAGTREVGTNINIKATDFEQIGQFVLKEKINMVVVGPEEPLVHGFYDYFLENDTLRHIPVIGPSCKGAMLEGSKDFAKQFMVKHNIPTARYKSFTAKDVKHAFDFLETLSPPYVLKADGLAAGKGVLILNEIAEAKKELELMFQGKFGQASATVVIEEFLKGIELSVFVLTDGISYLILPEAKDYKRVGDGDTGPNTGGMGAISPVPFADKVFMKKVEDSIVKPTIKGLQSDGIPYNGFIFLGLINISGNPYLIEYNVRMGDPETEAVMPRIKTDLVDLFDAVANKKLSGQSLDIDQRTVATVMLVSGGYPGSYTNGKTLQNLKMVQGSILFHAGTKYENNNVLTNGGRVIAISSFGDSIREALAISNKNASIIDFEGKYYRKDIGLDL